MYNYQFNLAPVSNKKSEIEFVLKPVTKIPTKKEFYEECKISLTRDKILYWNNKYDQEHPWWIKQEHNLGKKIRINKELGKEELIEIVKWKFFELEWIRDIVLNMVYENDDNFIKYITKKVFTEIILDAKKIIELKRIFGVCVALASVILTFYDPDKYGVFDRHVWREVYGKEQKPIFGSNKYYLKLLCCLRSTSKELNLPVRIIEKALFKKNLDTCKI